jgi:hypothetical protein
LFDLVLEHRAHRRQRVERAAAIEGVLSTEEDGITVTLGAAAGVVSDFERVPRGGDRAFDGILGA